MRKTMKQIKPNITNFLNKHNATFSECSIIISTDRFYLKNKGVKGCLMHYKRRINAYEYLIIK